jgi:hypothetical protein
MTGLANFLLIPSTNELSAKTLPDTPGLEEVFKANLGPRRLIVPKILFGLDPSPFKS